MIREKFLEQLPPDLLDKYEKAKSAFFAGKKFTSSGFPITPAKILSIRESICHSCDQWDAFAINGTGRCRKCGCSTWAKLRMATERCPLGKWDAVDISAK